MNKLILFLIVTLIAVVNAQELPCTETDNKCFCDTTKGVINLTPLGNQNGTARFLYEKNTKDETTTISYNPCSSATIESKLFPDLTNRECKNVAACLHQNVTKPKQFRMGFQIESLFKKIVGEDKYYLAYVGQDGESEKTNITVRTLIVNLKCDQKADVPTLNFSNVVQGDLAITVTLELTSKCACPGSCPLNNETTIGPPTAEPPTTGPPSTEPPTSEPPKKGLSTGSILVIIFFVFVAVYILGGVVYNKVVQGASGLELLPNVEFWSTFPLLVIDGVKFACNCCQTRRIGTTYDNM